MKYKSDEEIYSLVRSFEERTLPKSEWTHAAHLTVGLYYCFKHGFGAAKNLMGDGIYWLNDAHGTPNNETSGYHETLTFFWLRIISHFIEDNSGETSLSNLANNLVESFADTKIAFRFYSRELLFSPLARERYVKPDLENFPLTANGFLIVSQSTASV